MAVYKAMGWTPTGKVAVKLSTGEPPAKTTLIRFDCRSGPTVDGTIVGVIRLRRFRAETAHALSGGGGSGFTAIADFQIQDENGSMALPGGKAAPG